MCFQDKLLRLDKSHEFDSCLRYQDWAAYVMNHFYGPTKRVIYEVEINSGLVGLGESEEPSAEAELQRYYGTSPFEWMGGEDAGLGFQAAFYWS